ncbi:MAG: NADH-quinone oxidoreductase subunit C, partial [Candidatus Bathyarchaeota archaeon]|nr:NADH-quinone oxidoreductase subunit C [Candidatus Bathyarchaeota archaeon]
SILDGLTDTIGKDNVYDVKTPKPRKAYIRINVEKLRDAVTYLKEKQGFYHLAAITGMDLGDEREIVYHLNKPGLLISLKVRVAGNNPIVPSITGIINGATLYEREVHDIVGVIPEGHTNLKRVHLPEDWPEGIFPLLKKWDVKSLRKAIDGEEWT